LPLAELIARAVLLRRPREQCSRGPLVRTVGREIAAPRHRTRLDAEHHHRVAAQAGVEHHGRVCIGHRRPALEHVVVLVNHSAHDRTDVEGLLAVLVGGGREHVADGFEIADRVVVRVRADVAVVGILGDGAPR
jgi:hypothetical protein